MNHHLDTPALPRRRALQQLGALSLTGAFGVRPAWAAIDAYPARALRIVVPYPPGAINDVLARAIADRLTRPLGQAVIVDNKPGGNTIIGTQAVATAAPDGYTLLQVPASHAINAALNPRLPYDSIQDFSFITLAARAPFLLVVHKDLPVRNVQELVAFARKNPLACSYASSGTGGNSHLMGELLNHLAGTRMLHVPYKGTTAAINDVIGGQVQCTFSTYSGASAALRSGRLRAIAVTSAQRAQAFADIPTIAESGYPTYEAVGWWGFAAPAGTPQPILARLRDEIAKACAAPEFKQRLSADAVEVVASTADEFRRYLDKEIALWRGLSQKTRIQLD